MTERTWRILLIEDDEDDYILTREMLAQTQGVRTRLTWAHSYASGRQKLMDDRFDAVLLDYDLGMHTGIELIREFSQQGYPAPMILLTGRGSHEVDLEALSAGASLYLTKNEANALLLERTIRYAIERKQIEADLRAANERLASELSERRRAEAALRESEDRFRTTLYSIGDGVITTDTEGCIQRMNPIAEALTGVKEAEARGKLLESVFHIVDEPHHRPVENPVRRVLQEECIVGLANHTLLIRKDGYEMPIADSAAPIRDETGNVQGVVLVFRDQSAEREAQRALEASEANLALAERVARLGSWVLDLATGRGVWSAEMFHITGFDPIMLPPTFDEFAQKAHPDDLPVLLQVNAGVPASGQETTFEIRYHPQPGVERTLEGKVAPKRDPDGQVTHLVGTLQDITERKSVEKARRENADRLQWVVSAANVGLWDWDLETNQVHYSREWKQQVGYAENEISNDFTEWEQRVHPDDLERTKAVIQAYLARPWPNYQQEFRFRHRDGSYRTILAQASLTFDERGKPQRMVGSHVDITESRRSEQALRELNAELQRVNHALRESEARFRLLAQNAQDLIYRYEFFPARGFTYVSPAATAITGYTPAEHYADPELGFKLVHPDDVPVLSMATRGEPAANQALTLRWVRKDGQEIWTEQRNTFFYDEKGNLVAIEGIARDITERKEAELEITRLLVESQKRLKYIEALHTIDVAINGSIDLRTTLSVLLDHVVERLQVDAADVLLLNRKAQSFEIAAGKGFSLRSLPGGRISLGNSLAGKAVLEKRLLHTRAPEMLRSDRRLAQEWASEEFKAYSCVPLVAKGDVNGVLEIFHRTNFEPEPEWLSFLETLGGQAAIAIDNAQLYESAHQANQELIEAYDATIEGWSQVMDVRDKETEGHTQRVTEMTLRLAKRFGMDAMALTNIRRGALLHDIGKMGVPDRILFKPGPLTDEEWEVMCAHPALAYEMLKDIQYLRQSLDIPYCHHEKWDGTGYPRGLKGEKIPQSARIFAVADVWDALTSDRPYRSAWGHDRALEYIREQAGKHFDPQVVDLFLKEMEA